MYSQPHVRPVWLNLRSIIIFSKLPVEMEVNSAPYGATTVVAEREIQPGSFSLSPLCHSTVSSTVVECDREPEVAVIVSV
jgi:hypothetical protein